MCGGVGEERVLAMDVYLVVFVRGVVSGELTCVRVCRKGIPLLDTH